MPEGMEPGQMPEGFNPGERPEGGECPDFGDMTPKDFDPGQMHFDGFDRREENTSATCTCDTVFSLKEQVNAFSSVSDFKHDLQISEDGKSFVCNACGKSFDENGEGQIQESRPENPERNGSTATWVIVIVAILLLTRCIFFFPIKKKYKK